MSKVRKKRWLIAGVIVIIAVLATATCWLLVLRNRGPIPYNVRHNISFTLYYPKRLPQGYTVDRTSFVQKNGVIIFSVTTPNGKNIAVSEQAVPSSLPARSTTPAPPTQIPGQRNFTTPIGTAHLSLWGDKYVSDIVTSQTWIILNVTGLTADQASAVAQSFVGIN